MHFTFTLLARAQRFFSFNKAIPQTSAQQSSSENILASPKYFLTWKKLWLGLKPNSFTAHATPGT